MKYFRLNLFYASMMNVYDQLTNPTFEIHYASIKKHLSMMINIRINQIHRILVQCHLLALYKLIH